MSVCWLLYQSIFIGRLEIVLRLLMIWGRSMWVSSSGLSSINLTAWSWKLPGLLCPKTGRMETSSQAALCNFIMVSTQDARHSGVVVAADSSAMTAGLFKILD